MNYATHSPGTPSEQRPTRNLTVAERWLVQIMSEQQFGRIENLRIEQGQPAPDGSLRVIHAARFGTKDGGLKVPVADDPELKRAVWDLLEGIERLQNGYIVRLEFRHGLPFLLETTTAKTLGGPSAAASGEPGEKA
jgi:hypothetical protein